MLLSHQACITRTASARAAATLGVLLSQQACITRAASARAAIARIQAMNPPSASNAAMHLPPPHAAHVDGGTRQIRSDGAFGEARHQPIAHPSPDPNEQHVADGGNRMKTLITRHGILSPAHEAGARGIVNYVAAEAAESKTASGMLKNLWNDLTR